MRGSTLKLNFFLTTLISCLCFITCSSPQEKAEEHAFNDACPKYGFFTEVEIKKLIPTDPSAKSGFYSTKDDMPQKIEERFMRVAVRTYDNKIVHRDISALSQAFEIKDSSLKSKVIYDNFKQDFLLVCGSEAKPIQKTKYELAEETIQAVSKLKESKEWKKAIVDSYEFDYGEKGDQFRLAYLNSKENDILNKINYSKDPNQESIDRKIWSEIKKKKYVYISKDISQKYTNFYSDNYNIDTNTKPIYYLENEWYGYTSILPDSGIKVPQIESDRIPIKISPDLATKIKNGTKYNLDVIFSSVIQMSDYSYNYVYDNGLNIVLDDEKANLIKKADPYLYSKFSKKTGKGKKINLKPIYYIFSVPDENVIITNIKG